MQKYFLFSARTIPINNEFYIIFSAFIQKVQRISPQIRYIFFLILRVSIENLLYFCSIKRVSVSKTKQDIANRTVAKSLPKNQPIGRNAFLQRVIAFLSKVTIIISIIPPNHLYLSLKAMYSLRFYAIRGMIVKKIE